MKILSAAALAAFALCTSSAQAQSASPTKSALSAQLDGFAEAA